ncbi:MAG: hypothetical protein AABO58_21260 [Acidobacteriota bacterium]
MDINPQWIWIAAAAIGVVLVIALVASIGRRRGENLRPLTADARERFRTDWRRVEEMFVDRPATAVAQADELVIELTRVRGLTVRHPRVAQRYRAGHAVVERHGRGKSSTEELRQALLHFRDLFTDLAGERTDVPSAITTAAEIAPPRRTVEQEVIREEERPRT